jgi:hypothetical protein
MPDELPLDAGEDEDEGADETIAPLPGEVETDKS